MSLGHLKGCGGRRLRTRCADLHSVSGKKERQAGGQAVGRTNFTGEEKVLGKQIIVLTQTNAS